MDYISKNEFEKIIEGDLSLCVFSAEWCGPCKMLTPVLESYSGKCIESNNGITVAKINVDDQDFRETMSQNNVGSVPTLLLFSKGRCVASRTGYVSESSLSEWVDQYK